MKKDTIFKFEDLNVKIGQTIQVHPVPTSPERYDCILVGCLPGDAVMITLPESGSFPALKVGQQVVIRVMSANGLALFPTKILYISEVPVYMVYLDFPKAIKFKLVRNASRVDVALPVLVSNLTTGKQSGMAGKITDISTTGARLDMFEELGNVGDEVELKGKFEVANIQRILNIRAVIRQFQCKLHGECECGIEFYEEDEEKLLVLFGYIFGALAFGEEQPIT